MVYLITYELNNKEKDYTGLYEAIKSYGTWWHYIDSTWLVSTSDDVGDVSRNLLQHIDTITDNLLVIVVETKRGNKQGWLPRKAWDWINQRNI